MQIVWRASVDGEPAPELDLHITVYGCVPDEHVSKVAVAEWNWLAKDVRPILRRFFDRKRSLPAG